jgi:RimJ/RimL family protein N-acetyltransferase
MIAMEPPGTQIVRPPARVAIGEAVLERWSFDDLDSLFVAVSANLEHLRPWMPWAADHGRDSVAEFLAESHAGWERGARFEYAVRDPGAAVLGSAGLMGRIGPGGLEIGYWIDAQHTRRGIATLAAAALSELGLALSTVDRVEIHHDEANKVSGAIPARLGFSKLGTFPCEARAPGEVGREVRWRLDAAQLAAGPARALLANRCFAGIFTKTT